MQIFTQQSTFDTKQRQQQVVFSHDEAEDRVHRRRLCGELPEPRLAMPSLTLVAAADPV